MTTKQAIELLHRLQDEQFDGPHGDERREALEMAVRALEPNLGQKTIDCIIKRLNDEDRTTDDTIYRQQAIDAICKACSLTADYHKCDGYPEGSTWCEELVALREIPSAQLERKKGKWLVDEDGNMECPFCGNTCGFGNYCNECGADLRGERNEID